MIDSDELKLKKGEKLGAFKIREVNGTAMRCAEAKGKHNERSQFCLDTGMTQLIYATHAAGGDTLEYKDFNSDSGVVFPHLLELYRRGMPLAEVRIMQFTPENGLRELDLAPPSGPGVLVYPYCDSSEVVKAKPISQTEPPYPLSASSKGEEGTVRMWVILGRDGRLHGVTVIQSVTPDLDELATQAVRNWLYHPATCKGVPVVVETEIDINFTLHY